MNIFSKITSPTKRECKFYPEKIDIKKNFLKHLFSLLFILSPLKLGITALRASTSTSCS